LLVTICFFHPSKHCLKFLNGFPSAFHFIFIFLRSFSPHFPSSILPPPHLHSSNACVCIELLAILTYHSTPLSLFMVNICGHQTEHLSRTALHPSALLSYPRPRNDRHIYYSASRLWVSQTCSSISSLGRYWFFAKEIIPHRRQSKMSASF
jgi:hypothetical protein